MRKIRKILYCDELHFTYSLISGLQRHSKMLYNPLIVYLFYRIQSLIPVQNQMTNSQP